MVAGFLRSFPGLATGIVPQSSSGGIAPNAGTPGSTPSQKVDVNVFLKWLSDNRGVAAFTAPPITGASGANP